MNRQPIAIIGFSCRYPQSNSAAELWNNLKIGKDCLSRFTKEELLAAGYTEEQINNPSFVGVKGILSHIDQFDAQFFGFNPNDAKVIDPQQRLFLECAWEALEHSGHVPTKSEEKRISVFAGMADSCYLQNNLLKNKWLLQHYNGFQTRVATSIGTLATQLSYRFNLHGTSLNLNTACSTGLVVVSQACQDLLLKQSDVALAGAVAIEIPQISGYLFQPDGIDSTDGYCRPFSDKANGTVFSNGVGVVVLKRLEDAIADRDTIYTVIKGWGVNNDGHDKLSFVAPSVIGQAACIRLALQQADISPADIGFVEAHGTGTALGDLIEVTALKQVYEEYTQKKSFCALGSIKSNLGHTDIAAGIASLIKATLCLYHKQIPATLHLGDSHPHLRLAESPFYINQALITWPDTFRYAAVSAFGVGGTNAHLILEAYDHPLPAMTSAYQNQLIILSAKTEKALQKTRDNLINHIDFQPSINPSNLADLAYTLQVGREDFLWRGMGIGKTNDEIKRSLTRFQMIHVEAGKTNARVIFMFPGQGCLYPQAASHLYRQVPFFANTLNYCCQLAKPYCGENFNPLTESKDVQPAVFIIEYALAQLFIYWGVQPMAMIGHSVGEYTAACLAGVFSLEEVLFLLFQRGRLMEKTSPGAMLAIECSFNEFTKYKEKFVIELAAHNSSLQCVATGSPDEIEKLQQNASQLKHSSHRLTVTRAFHSRLMEPIQEAFLQAFQSIHLSPPHIPIISNLTGDWLTDQQATDPYYWYSHLRYPVQFEKGADTLVRQKPATFLEIGPGQTLCTFSQDKIRKLGLTLSVFSTLPNRQQPEQDELQLLTALGKLWQQGVNIHWPLVHEAEQRQRIPLPVYPFEHRRYWVDPDSNIALVAEKRSKDQWLFQPSWSRQSPYVDSVSETAIRSQTWFIFKDSLGLADRLIDYFKKISANFILIKIGDAYQQVTADYYVINHHERSDYLRLFSDLQPKIIGSPICLHLFSLTRLSKKLLTPEEIADQLDLSFYSVLYMVQAFIEKFGNKPVKNAIITCGAQDPVGGELCNPINATLIGPCRVIAKEHPLLRFQLLDVDEQEIKSDSLRLVLEILHVCAKLEWEPDHPVLALRHGYQWRPSYIPAQSEQSQKNLRDRGVYLLTGGLGGIALSLCEVIAKTVSQPVFILLSRSPFPASSEWEDWLSASEHDGHLHDKIKRLQEIQRLGAILVIQSVDVTDLKSLQAVIHPLISTYGTIHGIIHCAGIAGGGLTQLKTKVTAEAVLSPKIRGVYCLARALAGQSLDFVVFCSSVSALIGEPGQVDYCAANACLDAMAAAELFHSKKIISINWNTWTEVGMAVETERPDDIDFLDRDNHITPQEGQALFLEIIGGPYSQLVVSTKEITSYLQEMRGRSQDVADDMKISRSDLQISSSYVAPRDGLESQLIKIWQDILSIDSIGIEDDFFDLGGHSLQALYLVESINKMFHSHARLQDIYTEKTVANLARKIKSQKIGENNQIAVLLKKCEEKISPVFMCHPVSGLVFCYQDLITLWDAQRPIYGLQDPSIEMNRLLFGSINEMAEAYWQAIRHIQPHGPYYLLGYSLGATIMYEIAHLIANAGDKVEQLIMIDGWAMFSEQQRDEGLFKKMMQSYHPELSENLIQLAWQRMKLLASHQPSHTNQDIILFKATELLKEYQQIDNPYNGWDQFTTGKITCHLVPANHASILDKENLQAITWRLLSLPLKAEA